MASHESPPDLFSDASHLVDPSILNVYAPDNLDRNGPKNGIQLSEQDASTILSHFAPGATLSAYRVSTRGYNNRLYYLTVKFPSASQEGKAVGATEKDGEKEYIIKVCGRYWQRTKTETEVVGIWIAKTYAYLPTPMICEWDSDGKEFGVEYTVMLKLPGIPLSLVWKDLGREERRSIVKQLAGMVVQFKTKISCGVLPMGKIGNWVVVAVCEERKAKKLTGFDVGQTLDGDGPWSTYKAYLRTQLGKQLSIARQCSILEEMSDIWPRVEKLQEKLDKDGTIVDDTSFVFTHGDLDAQNLLVEWHHEDSADDTLTTPTINITAILDWEWSGMFPAEEEYFASYGFLEEVSAEDTSLFYDLLEEGCVQTPRMIPHYAQRKLLYDIKENIAPWFLHDHSGSATEVQRKVQSAKETVASCLEKLGY